MDKLRAEFEKWFNEEMVLHISASNETVVRLMWKAWQASRASIVVDTPQLCGDGENDSEYTEGYNDGITATEKTIQSIGLSIKGDEA
ncbi:TPA: hypothetical protein ACXIZC_002829 [Serratia marcescens]